MQMIRAGVSWHTVSLIVFKFHPM